MYHFKTGLDVIKMNIICTSTVYHDLYKVLSEYYNFIYDIFAEHHDI